MKMTKRPDGIQLSYIIAVYLCPAQKTSYLLWLALQEISRTPRIPALDNTWQDSGKKIYHEPWCGITRTTLPSLPNQDHGVHLAGHGLRQMARSVLSTNDGWPSPDGFDISKIDLQLTGPDPFGELLCLHMEVTSRFAHGVLHYPPHLTKHHGIQSLEGTDLQIYRYYQKGEHEHGIQFDPDYDMWSPGHDHLLSGQQVVIVLSNGSFRNLVLRRLERSPTDLPAYERIGSIYSGALRHQWLDENQTRYTFLWK